MTAGRLGTARARAEAHAAPKPRTPSGWEVVQVEQLRWALDRGSFELFAQPIVELSTDKIVQHELLIRMIDGRGELLAPGEFIPTAERFGMISELDHWVIEQAAEIAGRGHHVQVNISGGTLADPDLGAFVEHALAKAGADVRIVFEVTETALIGNVGIASRFFKRVRALGCGVALDDFGTGFGGFRYLKQFTVDYLKIDREFITDFVSTPASAKVVHSIVSLADEFSLETVAEGVEDCATLEQVRACGVDYAQGFLYSKPRPATEVLRGVIAYDGGEDPDDQWPSDVSGVGSVAPPDIGRS